MKKHEKENSADSSAAERCGEGLSSSDEISAEAISVTADSAPRTPKQTAQALPRYGAAAAGKEAEISPAGYIDSVYCGSGVDGKGLRCVVFFAGCNLRCPFCHNPETLFKQGTMTDVNTLVSCLERYKGYFRRGGVTLSGGEPFLQKRFALALVSVLHAKGIRCCFETNGYITDAELIGAAEYLIVDVKNQETDDLAPYEKFFAECVRQGKDVRVTNVLVPGKNDSAEKLSAFASLVKKYFHGEPSERIKFLPFRKLCEEKYAELSIPFQYAGCREGEQEDVEKAINFLKNWRFRSFS